MLGLLFADPHNEQLMLRKKHSDIQHPEIHNSGNIQALPYRLIDIQFYHIRGGCQVKNELFLTFFYVGFYGQNGRCPKWHINPHIETVVFLKT